jgi:hypothetical protein
MVSNLVTSNIAAYYLTDYQQIASQKNESTIEDLLNKSTIPNEIIISNDIISKLQTEYNEYIIDKTETTKTDESKINETIFKILLL